MKEWNLMDKEKLNINELKIFVQEKYDIHNDSQKLYMEYLIENNKKEFIAHYSKYQFVLNLETRKEIQNKIKDDKELIEILMIKNNIIPDDCISLRNILMNILKNISNVQPHKETIDIDLKKIFIDNHVYFTLPFDYLIPTKYSDNHEYKYNKLMLDVIHFLFPYEQILEAQNFNPVQKDSIYEKISLFRAIPLFLNKSILLNDNEFINRCDYIFNLFDIFFQVDPEQRNYLLLKQIITVCIPFDINNAKDQLKKLKDEQYFLPGLDINGSSLELFDPENLKEDSNITLKNKAGTKQITVKAKEINWYLGSDLLYYFNTNEFMICFTYETLLNKNYIKMNPINPTFTELFKKMIKSEVIKDAIIKDSEASQFEYLFSNDNIINECIESIYYVPFPVTGLYGFTDKNSFKTYIYSNLKVNSITSTLTEYDNIFKTKIHEFKHISRIYYHLFNNHISLSTPKTNKKRRDLISNNSDFMKTKEKQIKEAFEYKGITYKELDEMDYGDIFEMFFVGNKSSSFLLANSFFFLKEKSWDLKPKKFMDKYIESIKEKTITIKRYDGNHFINSVLNYFNFKSDKYYNQSTTKDSKKANVDENETGEYYNEYTYKITYSHYNFTK